MKQKKKLFIVLTVVCMLLINAVPALANSEISVFINEDRLEFDVPPQIINDRTMVPMRKIFESLGAVVTWDEPTRTATGKKDGVIVNVSIDSKVLFKNGVPKTLDVAPALIDGRTLVPVRAIAESFDCKVDWIGETRTVQITTDGTETPKTILTASEISEKVSPSVFYIEVYDKNDKPLGSGSGFFLSANGLAVTNYHVIEDSYSALIQTTNGEIYDVTNVVAFDETLDVAIIRVSKTSLKGKTVSGFPSIQTADSDSIKAGQTIYALGSPVGLQNTISNGIISNPRQTIGEDTFIQITAAISHGSSGGALVNEYGEVLGITSAGIEDAQNIGFAIPINYIKQFDLNADGIPYDEFAYEAKFSGLALYPATNIPTYTAITGITPSETQEEDGVILYLYPHYNVDTTQKYVDFLLEHGFTYLRMQKERGFTQYFYASPDGELISISLAFAFGETWIIVPKP